MNPAATAEPVKDVQGDDRWMSMHQRFSARASGREPEVVFVGDDFAERLVSTELWEKMFVPLHCLNFGIGGDQTQNVLWRLENGELENFSPKVIVVLAGTNNHGHSAEQVVGGLIEIAKTITSKQPSAQVIVMGIPPRGQRPNPLREKIATINASLAQQLSALKNVQFMNVDPTLFIQQDGSIEHRDLYDYLHFTNEGYNKLCEPLLEEIQNLLKTFVYVESAGAEPNEN